MEMFLYILIGILLGVIFISSTYSLKKEKENLKKIKKIEKFNREVLEDLKNNYLPQKYSKEELFSKKN